MIISAIIAVCNPDNCHPHLVRLHDRLWTCGVEMCPLTDTPHKHTHPTWHITCPPVIMQLLYILKSEFWINVLHAPLTVHAPRSFPACVSLPINSEKQHILSVCFLHLFNSAGWTSASLMSSWWACQCASSTDTCVEWARMRWCAWSRNAAR